MPASTGAQAALRLLSRSKTFPGVRALKNVDLVLRRGAVHTALGHDGSGKSTAIRNVAGVYVPDLGHGVLVLDQTHGALPQAEVDQLFELISQVRRSGTAVLPVTHRLDEVSEIGDDLTVLHDGEVVERGPPTGSP